MTLDPRSFVYNDGGRAAAGYQGRTGDCVCRAISIATRIPYAEVYKLINRVATVERPSEMKGRTRSHARTGVHKPTTRRIMEALGWEWHPTMKIGQGCRVHLRADELPKGRLVVAVSKHVVAVIDGTIHDTYDPSRRGTRCVYGYYAEPAKALTKKIKRKKKATRRKHAGPVGPRPLRRFGSWTY